MASELDYSMRVNLDGNVPTQANRYARSMESMADRSSRKIRIMQRSIHGLGRGLDRLGNRYTAFLTGGGLAVAGRDVLNIEERYERLGIQANKTTEEMMRLKQAIFDTSQQENIRIDPDQLLNAFEEIVEKTGGLEFARENIDNLALAISAAGARGRDIGGIVAEFQKMELLAKTKVREALDLLITQGKEGAFTFQNLAALGPRVITAYNSATKGARDGVTTLREMGAALQVIRMGTGSSEQAATAFERLLSELQNVDKIKMLKGAGIQVFDPNQPGAEVMRPINELLLDILKKTEGRRTLLGKLFGDEAIRSFNALSPERIEKFMAVQGDSTKLLQDSSRAANTAAGAMRYLNSAWRQFGDNNLAGPIEDLADTLNSLNPEQVQNYFEIAKTGVIALGTAIAASKVIGGISRVRGAFKSAKQGGLGGALGAAGATPVYVVNMPGAGLPGAGLPGTSGRGKRIFSKTRTTAALLGGSSLKTLPMYGRGAMALAGGSVGLSAYGGYTLGRELQLYENFVRGTSLDDAIGRGMAKFFAALGSKDAQNALDAEAKLKVIVEDGRVSVNSVESRGIDIEATGGEVMVAP